ncbi:phosphoribosyltransferase family protein [Streptomyces sp. ODS28]|uniref:phosphoribosyltransferase n=1 Tax=Streptomyces sp. ODS28 TaxID=3136688 RepID=UPI0031E88B7B
MQFRDREQAGRDLAAWFLAWADTAELAEPLVLALPRGGVPVGAAVARALRAPLDVQVARKIGAPGRPEAGIGAVAGEDPPVFDRVALSYLDLSEEQLADDVARERTELHRRERLYREGRPAPEVRGRAVLLTDDGLATGITALAALRHLRGQDPGRLILAVPVGSPDTARALRGEADDVVCLHSPERFHAVGQWYEHFDQVSDEEVMDTLRSFHAHA